MPFYLDSPNANTPYALDGVPTYLFGSYNYHRSNTFAQITQVALTSDVATISVQITAGDIPVVGSLLTITQTQTGSGVFNVNRVPITAVSINSLTGAGTISYALTSGNVAAVADSGTAIAEVPENYDTLPAGTSASIAACFQAPDDGGSRTMTISLTTPTADATALYYLQEAIRNTNGEFTTLAQLFGNATAGFVTRSGTFYRVLVTGATGGGTVIAKVL